MKNLNYLICSISDIQENFEYIFKKSGEEINDKNHSIKIYANKVVNRIMSKTKTECYLELLTPETMELLGSTKSKIAKYEDGKNASHFEINKVVLIHCNNVNNNYQQNSRVMYTFNS